MPIVEVLGTVPALIELGSICIGFVGGEGLLMTVIEILGALRLALVELRCIGIDFFRAEGQLMTIIEGPSIVTFGLCVTCQQVL